jgi:Flp pilus assembly protein TadD
MDPGISHQLQIAVDLLQRGELARATRLVAGLKRSHPSDGDVWALEGEIATREGRLPDALAATGKAVELGPQLPDRHVQRARCQVLAGLIREARASALEACRLGVARLDHLLVLAGTLVHSGDHADALRLYQQAAVMAPDHADVQRGLATVYRFLGRLQEAEDACDATLRLDPHDYEMANLRSSLRRQTPQSNHVEGLRALEVAGIRSWRGAVHVAYALAKEYEDLGDYEAAFSAIERGAREKRRHTVYNHQNDLAIFPSLMSAFSHDALRELEGAGHDNSDPIFVVGMPRTGSTLVERIISSHSSVQNLGELSTFSVEMMKLAHDAQGGGAPDRMQLAKLLLRAPMAELGANYLRAVAPMRDGRPRFIDKLPLNCLNIGLIRSALPKAKIVHVVREPMDACFAMYKYLFRQGYPFSYDLAELAGYYGAYFRLMQHWRDVLPTGHILDLHYENLVEDLPGTVRSLLRYLELSWEPACERFHENSGASTTGSAAQVRQALYGSSVGRWRHYERQLLPLRDALIEAKVPVH